MNRCDLGLARKLPNDFIVLEYDGLSPELRKSVATVMLTKPVSQALIPDVLVGFGISRLMDTPPTPLTAQLIGKLIDGVGLQEPWYTLPHAALLAAPLLPITRALLGLPMIISTSLRFDADHRALDMLQHRSGSKPEKTTSLWTIASYLPYLLESLITRHAVGNSIQKNLQSDRRISTQLHESAQLADYNRGQIDNAGRLVLSKHPLSRYATEAGLFKKIQRLASWYNPFRRVSFEIAPLQKKIRGSTQSMQSEAA